MAMVILTPDNKNKKPKKDYIDLSLDHKKQKKGRKVYKTAFFISFIINIIGLFYIVYK